MQYAEPMMEIHVMEDVVCNSQKIQGENQGDGSFGSINEYL